MTAADYLDALLEATPADKISAEFIEGLTDLFMFCGRVTKYRENLNTLQQARLAITSLSGPVF